MPKLTPALSREYQALFDTCQINPSSRVLVHKRAETLLQNRPVYEKAGAGVGAPWYAVAVIHNMESGLKFTTHLHNGDPLTARTKKVPRGRPPTSSPPFLWEVSAQDALELKEWNTWVDWSVPGMLFQLETYNGWGYRLYHPEVKSPYLWSRTNHYVSGKYVDDGVWSPTAVSDQIGAVALLRRLAELGEMDAAAFGADPSINAAIDLGEPVLRYAPDVVSPGGAELQQYLNQFPGIFLREDGKLGDRTSDAYYAVFGHYLLGDPRG